MLFSLAGFKQASQNPLAVTLCNSWVPCGDTEVLPWGHPPTGVAVMGSSKKIPLKPKKKSPSKPQPSSLGVQLLSSLYLFEDFEARFGLI